MDKFHQIESIQETINGLKDSLPGDLWDKLIEVSNGNPVKLISLAENALEEEVQKAKLLKSKQEEVRIKTRERMITICQGSGLIRDITKTPKHKQRQG